MMRKFFWFLVFSLSLYFVLEFLFNDYTVSRAYQDYGIIQNIVEEIEQAF